MSLDPAHLYLDYGTQPEAPSAAHLLLEDIAAATQRLAVVGVVSRHGASRAADRNCVLAVGAARPADQTPAVAWGTTHGHQAAAILRNAATRTADQIRTTPWGRYAAQIARAHTLAMSHNYAAGAERITPWGRWNRTLQTSSITMSRSIQADWQRVTPWGPSRPAQVDRSVIVPPAIAATVARVTPWGRAVRGMTPIVVTVPAGDPIPGEDGAQIIVPIREYYIVSNEVYLRTYPGGTVIEADSISVKVGVDDWCWSAQATIPASALSLVRSNPDRVMLEGIINGIAIRFFVEDIQRSRQFPDATLSVSGRGLAAELADPQAPVSNWSNTSQMTAQQIVAMALEYTGWEIAWEIDDWLVPANAFALQGTPMAVAQRIAEAAGAVVTADAALKTLHYRARYPVKRWDWATSTPDILLPADPCTTEGIRWLEKPAYNRVYVRGEGQGYDAQITITGSAGDILAPMITDPLATAPEMTRQRGIRVLCDTGEQAWQTLTLPVLPETGILDLCRLVEFTDAGIGETRRGLTRSVSVTATHPEVWQTVEIEAAP